MASGKVNAMAALLRGEVGVEGDLAAARARSSGSFPGPPRLSRRDAAAGYAEEAVDERRPRQDPRRQHVRRQRRARRHRGVADRSDRPVLVRHALPLEVGADRRTASGSTRSRPTTCSTSRRASSSCPGTGTVYVDAKLSVIRQRAVGDGFHEELTILNHDDEAGRRSTVRIEAGSRLRRPVRGQGRARRRRGRTTTRVERRPPACSATSARRSARETVISATAPADDRRERPDVHGRDRAARRAGRPTSTSSPRCRRRRRRTSGRSTRAAAKRARPSMAAEPRAVARATRRALECDWEPLEGDLPAQPRRSRRAALLAARSPAGGACPPPACRGS